jgi:hypothetical protein
MQDPSNSAPAKPAPVTPAVPEASQLLNETFARLIHATSVVSNFRTTLLAVSPDADKHLSSKLTDLSRDLFEAPEWEGLLVPIDPMAPESTKKPDYAALGKIGARAMLGTTYAQVDAATLIFYHSILDGVAFDCLRVTTLQAPHDWEGDLTNAHVGLLEARDQAYDKLLRSKIDKRLEALERESLLSKVGKLFACCKPEHGWSPMHSYAYDEARMEQFDRQRHEIVHGAAIGKPLTLFPVTDESLFYLLRTGMFFVGLINMRYGLQIDPNVWSTAAQRMA